MRIPRIDIGYGAASQTKPPGGIRLNAYELVTAITALSISIANDFPNNQELDVLGSIFVQLGETLETIAIQRELEEQRREKCGPEPRTL